MSLYDTASAGFEFRLGSTRNTDYGFSATY
jgi:hypothetical protein